MRRAAVFCLAVFSLCLLGACSGRDDGPAGRPSGSTAMAWEGELPLSAGWLRDRLPQNALLYQRIPNPIAMFAAPKGNVFNDALASDAHVRNLIAIRRGLVENVLNEIDVLDDPRLRLVFQHLRSPIELAILGPDEHSVNLSALMTVTLDLAGGLDFEDLVAGLADGMPGIELDDGGFAALEGLPVPVSMHFDAATGRVTVLVGPGVSAELLKARMGSLNRGAEHPMYALQKDIDQSGQGYFFWADPKNAMKLGQVFMPPEIWESLHDSGLDQVDSLAFGWGVANGKGRLRIAGVLPDVPARQFVPTVSNTLELKSVGIPDVLILASIPSREYFVEIERLLGAQMSEDEQQGWLDTKVAIKKQLGLSFDELIGVFGPEIIYFVDDVGEYSALRIRDEALWTRLTETISAWTKRAIEHHDYQGQTIHHWAIPSLYSFADLPDGPETVGVLALLMRMDEHLYWTREGDYLYVANIPQPLMDRIDSGATVDVGAWLRDSQRQDLSESIFAVSARINKVPRRLYYAYLELMQSLANLTNAPYDAWSLATAGQLDLPDTGSVGISLNLGDPVLALELSYESNPLEALLGSGMAGVAVVGVLAAIAIPAYQDYTLRAQAGGALVASSSFKTLVAEHYVANGRYPNREQLTRLDLPSPADRSYAIDIEPDTGAIVITMYVDGLDEDAQIFLLPEAGDGSLDFRCSSNIESKYMPKSCQSEASDD